MSIKLVNLAATYTINQSAMQPDDAFVQQAVQLLYEKQQETMRLLQRAQDQTQVLFLLHERQQALIAQQQQTIHQLAAELQACRSAQQSAFAFVHTN